jgi:hypothetical protein
MESDYAAFEHTDLLTGNKIKIKQEQEVTYFMIEPDSKQKCMFKVHGNLTYVTGMRNNNFIVTLVGNIYVSFDDQKVQIQLPEYVLSNYINIDGKPRITLINGPLCIVDNDHNLKAVVNIKGLVKKRVMFN